MTLGIAIAHRSGVCVAVDTRMTQKVQKTHADFGTKSIELTPRVAAVIAGHMAPLLNAIEPARSLLSETSARGGLVGLWEATRALAYSSNILFKQYQDIHEGAACEIALAGFYSDGRPGVAGVTINSKVKSVSFARRRDKDVAVSVGSSHKRLLETITQGRDSDGTWTNEDIVAGIQHFIRRQSLPSIGGSVAYGQCAKGAGARFAWPMVKIENNHYYRGAPIPSSDIHDRVAVWEPEIDTNFMDSAERKTEEAMMIGAPVGSAKAHFQCTLDELTESPFETRPEPYELCGLHFASVSTEEE